MENMPTDSNFMAQAEQELAQAENKLEEVVIHLTRANRLHEKAQQARKAQDVPAAVLADNMAAIAKPV